MTIEADDLDHAANMTLEAVDREVKRLCGQAAKIDTRNPGGMCWACDEQTGIERRFCSLECRDAWAKENE